MNEEIAATAPELRAGAAGSSVGGPGGDERILQTLTELRGEISALRVELLGQSQQMLSRIQFLHEGLIGRIKQMREQPAAGRKRPFR